MLNEADFLVWCTRLALTAMAREAVAEARSRDPARRVGGGRLNVSGRYPSRKMGATIQFESHRVELPSFMRWSTTPKCWSILTSRLRFRWLIERPMEGVCRSCIRRIISCFAMTQPGGKNARRWTNLKSLP